jgi:haloalkane dehalogenase
MMDRPNDVVDFTPSPEFFPFESRWFESSVGSVHYIDEGEGRPILFMHGNPDWSFLYRKLVSALKGEFRCVAVDYPGFGLSVHPKGYRYTAKEHAGIVGELVDHLDLQDFIVMGQDWGGPIGMGVASERADRIHGLVMGNTWFWPEGGFTTSAFSVVMSSFPIQQLIKRRNFFVSPLMKRMLQAKLSDAEFNHYRDVVPTPESREGIAVFPREIRAAKPWLAEVATRVEANLADKKVLLTWGMKDPAFGRGPFLKRWESTFSDIEVVKMAKAGHYIQEDAPDQIAEAIRSRFGG